MLAAGQQKQFVEFSNQRIRAPFFIKQCLLLCVRVAPDDVILVKAISDLIPTASQMQSVHDCHRLRFAWMHRERSQLNIFESTLGDVLLRFSQQRGQVVFVVNKRIAMIGKRKRDHAPPSQTAMHFAKWNAGHNAVFGIRQDARNANEYKMR